MIKYDLGQPYLSGFRNFTEDIWLADNTHTERLALATTTEKVAVFGI